MTTQHRLTEEFRRLDDQLAGAVSLPHVDSVLRRAGTLNRASTAAAAAVVTVGALGGLTAVAQAGAPRITSVSESVVPPAAAPAPTTTTTTVAPPPTTTVTTQPTVSRPRYKAVVPTKKRTPVPVPKPLPVITTVPPAPTTTAPAGGDEGTPDPTTTRKRPPTKTSGTSS